MVFRFSGGDPTDILAGTIEGRGAAALDPRQASLAGIVKCRFRRCRHVIPRSCRQAFRYDAATPEGRFSTV
jgi:hypothetical protein